MTLSASSLIMIPILSLFESIRCSWSLSSLLQIKLIAIVSWIFYVLDFLRLFMIFLKHGLILFRYSSIDIVFLSLLLLYSI